MTRRFADLRTPPASVGEESVYEQPAETPPESVRPEETSAKAQTSRSGRAESEALMVVQARVPQGVRRNFSKVLIDIQDDFSKAVSQEESITALLHLVAENPQARALWVAAIQKRREES